MSDKARTPELSMAQIKADMVMARQAMVEARNTSRSLAKYLRGQAGYHLQQAAEKLIKIQMYHAEILLNYAKIYKHNLAELIAYAESLNMPILIPDYIRQNCEMITLWETDGRYDIHVVVRIDRLKRCYGEIEAWFSGVKKVLKNGV